ncbi:N-acetylneuraminate synthase family protein [Arenicellales bacterium IMCC55707]
MLRNLKSEFEIKGKKIGLSRPSYFIADIAANHDGSLERAKSLIWLAAEAGADAAKFQHFDAKKIVSDYGFQNLGDQKSHQAEWEKSVVEVYQAASLDLGWTDTLQATCNEAGIAFFTSPYDFDRVDHIDPFVPAYKIGSGDITWHEIIRHIASKGKPYMLATGASRADEIVKAVEVGIEINPQIALMQCNTNYTGSIENMQYIHLNVLKTYAQMFPGMILGLSDHTPGHATVLGAVALGARIIEKHFTDDSRREGPDHKFSMNPQSWREMVDRTRELESALGGGIKKIENNEQETVVLQRRSLRLIKCLDKDHVITECDLEALRPCPIDAIPPYDASFVVGRRLRRGMSGGDYIRISDLD